MKAILTGSVALLIGSSSVAPAQSAAPVEWSSGFSCSFISGDESEEQVENQQYPFSIAFSGKFEGSLENRRIMSLDPQNMLQGNVLVRMAIEPEIGLAFTSEATATKRVIFAISRLDNRPVEEIEGSIFNASIGVYRDSEELESSYMGRCLNFSDTVPLSQELLESLIS